MAKTEDSCSKAKTALDGSVQLALEAMDHDVLPVGCGRRMLALEAAWEIESAAIAMADRSPDLDAGDLVFRSLSLRVRDLSRIIMSALDDEVESVTTLKRKLAGAPLSRGDAA